MIFWVTAIAMTLIFAAFLVAPVLRRRNDGDASASDVEVYKAQLAEIDRDKARGLLDDETAERTRAEVSRRLIAAAKVAQDQGQEGSTRAVALLSGVILISVSFAAYWIAGSPGEEDQPLAQRLAEAERLWDERPSQAEMVAMAPAPPKVDAPKELLTSVQRLRDAMQTRPNDPRGWELLAFYETELRNYDAAAQAQDRLLALKQDPTVEDLTRLVDLMVAAADGSVSPEAEVVARQLLNRDAENLAGRYYIGAIYNQTGRPDEAFRIWRPMVDAGAGDFHTALATNSIENAALRAGIEYAVPDNIGPGLDAIAAAEGLSEEERSAMIVEMVSSLSTRLSTQGGTVTEWAQLIRSYAALGETQSAQAVLREATQLFGSDPNAAAVLRDIASRTGLTQ